MAVIRASALVVGCCAIMLLLAGCPESPSSEETDENPLPYAGTAVRVALPARLGLVSSWTPGFEDWAAETEASYSVSEIDFAAGANAEGNWQESLAAASPTLVLLPTKDLSRLLEGDQLAPIPESAIDADVLGWGSISPAVRKALGMLGDKPTVVPVTCPTLVAFYRKDLLDAAALSVPQTWEEYDALVATLGEWAPGHMAIEPRGPDSLATLFLARAAASARSSSQFSFELDASTGDPLIASAAFVRTLERMVLLSGHLSPDANAASLEDCARAVLNGKAAIGIAAFGTDGTVGSAAAEREISDAGEAVFKFTPLPGSPEVFARDSSKWRTPASEKLNRPVVCGFGGLCACAKKTATEGEQAAAWDLWGSLIALQDEGIIPPLPGIPSRPAALASAVEAVAGSLAVPSRRSLEQAMTANITSPHLIAELPCMGREQLLAALGDALRRSLDEGISAQQTLDKAAQSWTRIIEERGRKQVLNSYRRRLGLSHLP